MGRERGPAAPVGKLNSRGGPAPWHLALAAALPGRPGFLPRFAAVQTPTGLPWHAEPRLCNRMTNVLPDLVDRPRTLAIPGAKDYVNGVFDVFPDKPPLDLNSALTDAETQPGVPARS